MHGFIFSKVSPEAFAHLPEDLKKALLIAFQWLFDQYSVHLTCCDTVWFPQTSTKHLCEERLLTFASTRMLISSHPEF